MSNSIARRSILYACFAVLSISLAAGQTQSDSPAVFEAKTFPPIDMLEPTTTAPIVSTTDEATDESTVKATDVDQPVDEVVDEPDKDTSDSPTEPLSPAVSPIDYNSDSPTETYSPTETWDTESISPTVSSAKNTFSPTRSKQPTFPPTIYLTESPPPTLPPTTFILTSPPTVGTTDKTEINIEMITDTLPITGEELVDEVVDEVVEEATDTSNEEVIGTQTDSEAVEEETEVSTNPQSEMSANSLESSAPSHELKIFPVLFALVVLGIF